MENQQMKAFVVGRYGGPEAIRETMAEMPQPKDDEVLVRVIDIDRAGKIRLSRKEALEASL